MYNNIVTNLRQENKYKKHEMIYNTDKSLKSNKFYS